MEFAVSSGFFESGDALEIGTLSLPSSSTKVTKSADIRAQFGHFGFDVRTGAGTPALNDHFAIGRQGGDESLFGKLAEKFRCSGGADDDTWLLHGLNLAVSASRMPPPTRQGAMSNRSRMVCRLLPQPRAASRSTTAISPTRANRSAIGRGSPASMARVSPWMSCTAFWFWRSILGKIMSSCPRVEESL